MDSADSVLAATRRYLRFLLAVGSRYFLPTTAALLLGALVSIGVGFDYASLFALGAGLLLVAFLVLSYPLLVGISALAKVASHLPRPLLDTIILPARLIAAVTYSALMTCVLLYAFPPSRYRELVPAALLFAATATLGYVARWETLPPRALRRLSALPPAMLILAFLAHQFPQTSHALQRVRPLIDSVAAKAIRQAPAEVLVESPSAVVFADPVTGESVLWFESLEGGGFRFYSSEGYDRLGRPLEAADAPEERIRILEWLASTERAGVVAEIAREQERDRLEEEMRSAEARALAEMEEIQQRERELEQQERQQKELRSVRRLAGTAPQAQGPELIVALAAAEGDASRLASRYVIDALRDQTRSLAFSDRLSRSDFTASPYFERLKEGDASLLREAGSVRVSDAVMAGTVAGSCRTSDRFAGLRTCRVEVEAIWIRPNSAVQRFAISGQGPGLTEDAALRQAAENALRASASQIPVTPVTTE